MVLRVHLCVMLCVCAQQLLKISVPLWILISLGYHIISESIDIIVLNTRIYRALYYLLVFYSTGGHANSFDATSHFSTNACMVNTLFSKHAEGASRHAEGASSHLNKPRARHRRRAVGQNLQLTTAISSVILRLRFYTTRQSRCALDDQFLWAHTYVVLPS